MSLELKNISMTFGDNKVYDNFSYKFAPSGCYLINSPSGAGKTTLLRIILGLQKPTSGEVISSLSSKAVGTVFQEDRLFENLTAIENIQITSPDIPAHTVSSELEKLLPADSLTKPVSELSGGMRRRVAIVRAMITDSDMYILDEPLSGLDFSNQEKAIEYIRSKSEGKLMIIASHNKTFESFCTVISGF